jgi:hypothetical protein
MLRQPLSDTLLSIATYVMKIKMSGAVEQKERTQEQQDCPDELQYLHLRFGSNRIGSVRGIRVFTSSNGQSGMSHIICGIGHSINQIF